MKFIVCFVASFMYPSDHWEEEFWLEIKPSVPSQRAGHLPRLAQFRLLLLVPVHLRGLLDGLLDDGGGREGVDVSCKPILCVSLLSVLPCRRAQLHFHFVN